MLISEIINANIPQLHLQDSVAKAKQLIGDFKLTHLPVVAEHSFLGLVSEEDLLDVEDEKLTIETSQPHFINQFVFEDLHILHAINYCNQQESNIVPVLNRQQQYVGVTTAPLLLKYIGDFTGANEMGGIIVLEMERVHFSVSEISRIVESNDCTILHLNTISNPLNGIITITLHINKTDIATLVATFERYEYTIQHQWGIHKFEDRMDENYKNLMNYLQI